MFYDRGDCCIDDPNSFLNCEECYCFVNVSSYRQNFQCDWSQIVNFFNGSGNGICNLQLNNMENFFDAGDCCMPGAFYKYCRKSNFYCDKETTGDGICQDFNNGPLCDFDLGDCCLPITNQHYTEECCFCLCQNWHPIQTQGLVIGLK